ncbi:MAG: hypothetical protein AAFX87_09340 [Bacteroidota bacterium]
MKKLIIFVLIYLPFMAIAQEVELHEMQTGYFVPLGEEVPTDFSYRLSRKSGSGSFEVIGEFSAPATKNEYTQQLQVFHNQHPLLMLPIESQIDRIWEIASAPQNNERLPILSPVIENLALGRAFSDTTVSVGQTYQYKIEKISGGQIVSTNLTVERAYFRPREVILPDAEYFKHTLFEGKVVMQWLLFDKNGLTGVEVYRQDNLRGGFNRIDIPVGFRQNLDSTFIHITDTTANQFEVYEYKLRPYDFFGNPGAFTQVAKISNFTTHDFPKLETFSAVALDNRQVKIQWQMEYKPFIRSIKILRSMSFDDGFEEITEVSPSDSAFVDVLPISMENYYYRLRVNGPDEIGVTSSSTFVLYESDLVPDPPAQVAARTMDRGVHLKWEDRQRNIHGYYVYRQFRDEGFVQISEPVLRDSIGIYQFVDSTQNLRGDRFYDYAIKSISDSYVLSPFSDTLTARPGITVAIASPRNLRGRKADGKVHLFWEDQSIVDNNLIGYKLFRKKSFDEEFKVLHDSLLSTQTNHFTDTLIEKGYAYDYAVKSYNYFGGQSEFSDTIQFAFYLPLPSPPAGVKAQKTSEGIRILWGKVFLNDLKGFSVYKYLPDQEPLLVAELLGDEQHFVDDQVQKGQLYFYYVTSKNEQEIEGRASEVVSVRY